MISSKLDFAVFLAAMTDKDRETILQEGDQEVRAVEALTARTTWQVATRAGGSVEYAERIGKFLAFLRSGTWRGSPPAEQFAEYRRVCERLVGKGQLAPDVLRFFGQEF